MAKRKTLPIFVAQDDIENDLIKIGQSRDAIMEFRRLRAAAGQEDEPADDAATETVLRLVFNDATVSVFFGHRKKEADAKERRDYLQRQSDKAKKPRKLTEKQKQKAAALMEELMRAIKGKRQTGNATFVRDEMKVDVDPRTIVRAWKKYFGT